MIDETCRWLKQTANQDANPMGAQIDQLSSKRDLIKAMVVSFISGLLPTTFCASLFLQKQHFYLMINPTVKPVSASMYNSLLDSEFDLVFGVLPSLGFAFIVIGYYIWKAYRRLYR
jgi:hypothetical protein